MSTQDHWPCLPTLFSWLGMIQRRKLGLVFLSVAISLVRDSLYSWPTVRNIPFLVLSPAAPNETGPLLSPADTWSMATILSTRGNQRAGSKS